jgi:selenocysteine lyase/cysteine desulfurase
MSIARRELMTGMLLQGAGALRADDEGAWSVVQRQFAVDRGIVNLNHAGVGTCPIPVIEAAERLGREGEKCAPGTIFGYAPKLEPIRAKLAGMLHADPEEVAIVRNATEALQAVLLGFPLKQGDEVLTTSLDYWAMIDAIEQRRDRDGAVLRKVEVPAPATMDELVAAVVGGINDRTKLILLSHPINLNGQLFPVRRICDAAHARGIEVVVDAAQSFGMVPLDVRELGCDYLGTSLHKWLQAPKGSGMLYVRRDKIRKVWPLFAAGSTKPADDIRKFELFGTWPETILAIDAAIAWHQMIGAERKERRLRHLTARWLEPVRKIPGVRVHTPLDPQGSCGIATIELAGWTSARLRQWLLDEKKILTMDVARRTKQFQGVRVSAGLSTTIGELDRFVMAIEEAKNRNPA